MNSRPRPLGATLVAAMLLAALPAIGDGPGGFTTEPLASDGLLYSVNHITGELITIDPNTAAMAVVGPVGFGFVEGLTYHEPTDSLLAFENATDQLIAINRHTGEGTAIGPTGRDFVFGLTYSEHNDTLYAVDTEANELLTLNQATGAVVTDGPLFFDFVGGLTDNPATGVLYGVDYGTDQVFVMDLEGGLSGPIVDVVPSSLQGVAFDSTTADLFAISVQVGPESLLRIDPLTDTVSVVGMLDSVSLASLAYVPNTVPEPSSFATLMAGALVANFFGRPRRAPSAPTEP